MSTWLECDHCQSLHWSVLKSKGLRVPGSCSSWGDGRHQPFLHEVRWKIFQSILFVSNLRNGEVIGIGNDETADETKVTHWYHWKLLHMITDYPQTRWVYLSLCICLCLFVFAYFYLCIHIYVFVFVYLCLCICIYVFVGLVMVLSTFPPCMFTQMLSDC